ncbi:MAG: two-component system sensor histidine kinase CreC [Methylophilaceae bacterium]
MKISLKIFLGYFLLVGLAAWFILTIFVDEVKPGVRQAMEDSLVDTAEILAALAADDFSNQSLASGGFAKSLTDYQNRTSNASIWGVRKNSMHYRVYICNAKGIVVFDSEHISLGQDYSRWNDVYLTLHGKYGVRSSPETPGDNAKTNTVMYVAAPIMQNGNIVGSLTVAKPNRTMLPFIERAQRKIMLWGALLLGLSLFLGVFFTWRFTRAIHRLRDYAIAVSQGKKAENPTSSNDELADLANAMDMMRSELDGKAHVQDAIHQLTHELKSPITAIQAASELISPTMPAKQQQQFIGNIKSQSARLLHMIQNILGLAALEQQQTLRHSAAFSLNALVIAQIQAVQTKASQRDILIQMDAKEVFTVNGDAFLLGQAVNNLLENALDFSPQHSTIALKLAHEAQQTVLSVQDQGTGIPDYAMDKIFDKFYSLPRPDFSPNVGKKSTGLGLNFVREIMQLHKGTLNIANAPEGGTIARLIF